MLLSNVLAYKEGVGDAQAQPAKQISPVAWQHINLYGRYEFRKPPEIIDFDAIVQELSRVPISSTWLSELEYTFSGGYAKIPK